MNDLLIGLVGALVATNQPLAVSNLIQQQSGITVQIPNAADPVESELKDIMIADDAATDEVDQWIKTNQILQAQGKGESNEDLNKRIVARFDEVRQKYKDFLQRHPNYARGYMAYGSFLDQVGDEDAARTQYENARQIDPKNPAAWNNLGNYYGEFGPVTNAFAYYTEAMRLDPQEPTYIHNLAVTVYLFRRDAEQFYDLTEAGVFDKSIELYRQAMKLAPRDFVLASDFAENYYGIKPFRTNDALAAWTNAFGIARTDAEREGVDVHLARVNGMIGRYPEAHTYLNEITNSIYGDVKVRIERNLAQREHPESNLTDSATSPGTILNPAVTNASLEITNASLPVTAPKPK